MIACSSLPNLQRPGQKDAKDPDFLSQRDVQLPHGGKRQDEEEQVAEDVERPSDIANHNELAMAARGKAGLKPVFAVVGKAQIAVNGHSGRVHC